MKIPMMIFLSAALIAPPELVFAAAADSAAAPKYCADSLGRRIACAPAREGRSVGEADGDETPWLVGGGLLLAGGVAAAAIAATNGGDGGRALFLTTVNNYTTNPTTIIVVPASP